MKRITAKKAKQVIREIFARNKKKILANSPIGRIYAPDFFPVDEYGENTQDKFDSILIKNGWTKSKLWPVITEKGAREI